MQTYRSCLSAIVTDSQVSVGVSRQPVSSASHVSQSRQPVSSAHNCAHFVIIIRRWWAAAIHNTRELISVRKTSHKYSNKHLSRLRVTLTWHACKYSTSTPLEVQHYTEGTSVNSTRVISSNPAEDVPLVGFYGLVFTHMPGQSYRRRLRTCCCTCVTSFER